MREHGLTRLKASAIGVAPANARHRPGCNAHPCRGRLTLHLRNTHAPTLARRRFLVRARSTRAIAIRLSNAGLAYLGDRERARAVLHVAYSPGHSDSFRMTILG